MLALNRFELLIDWGWFYFITKPLFKVIDYFFVLVGNFGLAILIVTVLIKIVFFPSSAQQVLRLDGQDEGGAARDDGDPRAVGSLLCRAILRRTGLHFAGLRSVATTRPTIGPFLMLGVWPIIMGITMWVQMKLNPAPPDPTQKMIFDWMPLIFTFMLASFSAGLVIYWAWNNTLSVMQQAFIMNKHGAKISCGIISRSSSG